MHAIAFVFPGQGSQSIGMAARLLESSAEAKACLDEADAALGEPLSALIRDGDPAELDQTVNAQPALLATSIAYLRALSARWVADDRPLQPRFFAGHSMGQYSAMVAAGVLTLADGVRLVRERGRLMQAAGGDGAMAAIVGLPDERLADLEAAGRERGIFAIANHNSPGQVVVSGERGAVDAAAEAAKNLGAKRAIVLPVSVAAHSPLMAGAADGMRAALADVAFADPSAPLLANSDARPLTTAAACREELIEHLTRGVDWVAAVASMRGQGVDTFLEVGPGKVLTGLIRRIAPDAEAIAVDDPAAPDGLAEAAIRTPSATAPA
jgi:[acyl-carrier-protein] S-malonyltransferase